MAGIYIHIPFCKRRCIYCDFFSTTASEKKNEYIKALCKEIKSRENYLGNETIDTIYLGGGTPSQLEKQDFVNIFNTIYENYKVNPEAEITIEANPDDLTEEYVKMLSTLPFNRLSMGIQTFNDDILALLKRRHNAQQAIDAFRRCRNAGFLNISIDLMYGLPGESMETWNRDLETAISLAPEHISAYHLIYEEGKLLQAVADARADVAFARACTYEELVAEDPEFASLFRPIHVKESDEHGFQCLRSTDLLPNWTIVSTSLAPWQVSRDVSVALLDMPTTADGFAWGVVSDFARVDDLYRDLKVGPYSYLRVRTVQDFVRRYWHFLAITLLIVSGLALHSWRSGVLVRKRTQELQAVMESERQALRMAQEERRQKELLEQVSVIGAMSSLITHEMNAPLNAISNATHSLERFFENNTPAPLVSRALDLIRSQCALAAEIVQHVRSYVKRREILRKPVDMTQVTKMACRDQSLKHPAVKFVVNVPQEEVSVAADNLEIELALTNLVRNAIDALAGTPEPRVEVSLSTSDSSVLVSVRDNAITTSAEDVKMFSQSRVESTKSGGLGLGLLIVRTIVERHAGHMDVEWADPGLRFTLTLPKNSFTLGETAND